MTGNGRIPGTSPDVESMLPTRGTDTGTLPTHGTLTGMPPARRQVYRQLIETIARFPRNRHTADTFHAHAQRTGNNGKLVLQHDYYKGSERARQLIPACPPPQ